MASYEDWKAAVEKELAGAAFDKLVTTTAEGLQVQPLYADSKLDPGIPGQAPYARGAVAAPGRFKICMRVDPPEHRRPGALLEDLDGGADALWIAFDDYEAQALASQRDVAVIQDSARDAFATAEQEEAKLDLIRKLRRAQPALGRNGAVESNAPNWLDFDHISATVRGENTAWASVRSGMGLTISIQRRGR